MIKIKIDNTGDGIRLLYGPDGEWKDYVCECFDSTVVLYGNRNYRETVKADWYRRAKDVLEDIDGYGEYPENLSEEVNAELKRLYEKCRCTDDILPDVIRLLNPEDTFTAGTVRGYCQGDWQYYIVKGSVDVKLLESFYFGNVADITVETDAEQFYDVITHDELWKAENDGPEKFMRARYEIAEDEPLMIFQADGMKRVPDWKQIV